MSGRKKTFRLTPTVGAPLRRPPRRRLPRAMRRKAGRAFLAAGIAVTFALAATMIVLHAAWD